MSSRLTSLSLLALALTPALASSQQPRLIQTGDKMIYSDAFGRRAVALRSGYENQLDHSVQTGPQALETGGWVRLGGFGGLVEDIAVAPIGSQYLMCGTAPVETFGSIYWTNTTGEQWTENTSWFGGDVHDIEYSADGRTYAGGSDGLSYNWGGSGTFHALPLGIGFDDEVFAVTIDPTNTDSLWVGVGAFPTPQTQNLLHSEDWGVTWLDRTPIEAAGMRCTGIELDPLTPGKVFAIFGGVLEGGSAWRSLDSGLTWTEISAGLPPHPLTDIAYVNGKLLVSGGGTLAGQEAGLFSSDDEGATWLPLHDATWPSRRIRDIEVDAMDSNKLYVGSAEAGIFRSDDQGATWTFGVGDTGLLTVNKVLTGQGEDPLWAGATWGGAWKSEGAGDFHASSDGIGPLGIFGLGVNANNPDELAVAYQGLNDGGVFSSVDAGQTWKPESLPFQRYNDVAFAPDGTLMALADGPSTVAPEGIYRRDGNTWTSIGPDIGPAFEVELLAIEFDPNDPDHILAGGSDTAFTPNSYTIWHTADGGGTWTKTGAGTKPNRDINDIKYLPDGTGLNALATFSGGNGDISKSGGVLRTSDGGLTWQDSSTGLPLKVQGWDLEVVGYNPTRIYLSDFHEQKGGLYKSIDSGATWVKAGGKRWQRNTVADPLQPGRLYMCGVQFPYVYISSDDGASIQLYKSGLTTVTNPKAFELEVMGKQCTTLVLATLYGAYTRVTDNCRLEADLNEISLGDGGRQSMTITATPQHGGEFYLLLGSAQGTAPGLVLDGHPLPLNPDDWMDVTIGSANGPFLASTFGLLDDNGESRAPRIDVAPGSMPALAGTTLHHAAVVFTLEGGGKVTLTTNAQALTLIP
jgi:photosystem II stability/assembly factor-like uncharacterized protein